MNLANLRGAYHKIHKIRRLQMIYACAYMHAACVCLSVCVYVLYTHHKLKEGSQALLATTAYDLIDQRHTHTHTHTSRRHLIEHTTTC